MPTAAVMVMRPPWLSGVMTVLGGIGVWDMAIGFRAASAAGLKSRERDQEQAKDDR